MRGKIKNQCTVCLVIFYLMPQTLRQIFSTDLMIKNLASRGVLNKKHINYLTFGTIDLQMIF
jgi:hypothetical protein